MKHLRYPVLALCMSLLLVACIGPAPTPTPLATATPPPTNTPIPATNTPIPPTRTPVPTAPQATSATPAAGRRVVDPSGKCQMILDPAFKESSTAQATYTTDDQLAFVSLTGAEVGPLSFANATTTFIETFKTFITGFQETGRQQTKINGRDAQIVEFTGKFANRDVRGGIFFIQFDSVLCSLTAVAAPPGDAHYSNAVNQMIASVGPTSTGAATLPTPTIAATARPSAVPTTATASTAPVAPGGGTRVLDSAGLCQMTVPASFKAGSSGDTYQTDDNLALVTLGSSESGGLSFSTYVQVYVETFKAFITDYQEVSTSQGTINGKNAQIVTFTGNFVGQSVKGAFYFLQGKQAVCSLTVLTSPPGDTLYANDVQSIISSLDTVAP